MTSVPADDDANLRAGRPTVKKNMSVPHTTAVLRMPTRGTGHIQWFIVPSSFLTVAAQTARINKRPTTSITTQVTP